MASEAHQWLVLWIARKMVADGILLTGYEGPTPQGGVWNELPRPLAVAAFRPDVAGVSARSGGLAFGEAKTEEDIDNPHTVAQLRAFCFSGMAPPHLLYLAVPRSAAYRLDRVLAKARLARPTRVLRLHVPDCFVNKGAYDFA